MEECAVIFYAIVSRLGCLLRWKTESWFFCLL